MAKDPELLTHLEWLGYLQPVGLVVSPPALVAAQAFPAKNIIPEHTRFLEVVEQQVLDGDTDPRPVIRDFPRFAVQILGWEPADLLGTDDSKPVPDTLEVPLPEYNETLRPTYAVPEFDKAGGADRKWLILIQRVSAGLDLDKIAEIDSKDQRWQATPQARFERLLRESQVPIGLLSNETHFRLVYAPRGETSGHLTFPVQAMTEVPGRPIFAALQMLLSGPRLFSLPEKQRLPAILAESRSQERQIAEFRSSIDHPSGSVLSVATQQIFILRQTTPGITMTDISYATMKAEACHLPGGGLGVLFRTTVFRPEPHIELVLEQSGRLPKSFEAAPYHEIQLFNAQKLATGTLRDVLADFVSTMAKNNQLTESLTKDFQDPTFIRSTGSKRFFRLHSLRAKIDIVKEELPPIRLKPPGFVDFVLEDFETGKKQSFVQPVMKNGK
jgi:hypothetical protein